MPEPLRSPVLRGTARSRTNLVAHPSTCALVVLVAGVLVLATGTPAWTEDAHAHHKAQMAAAHDDTTSGEVTQLGGLSLPDVPLVDQDGNDVRFYQDLVEDRVVAVNFVFTTCTTVCPPMGANFAAVQRQLAERLGRDVHLISVSVDPVIDTPARMKAWGERFGAGPGWTLVTGEKADVDRLLKSLQVFTPDVEDHAPTVLVGNDAAGTWKRAYGLAPAPALTALIDEVAALPALEEEDACPICG